MKNPPNDQKDGAFKNLVLWLVIIVVLVSILNNFGPRGGFTTQMAYSEFVQAVSKQEVQSVTIDGTKITGDLKGKRPFVTYMPMPQDQLLLNDLIKQNVHVQAQPPEEQSLLLRIFISWFPMLLVFGLMIYWFRQMQGGGGKGGPMSFGRSRARMLGEDQVNVRFNDVAGINEAKEEVQEVVEFLRDPTKFQKLGGKIPCGVLLVGPPGSGKTLLAKAVAGEAGVSFFTISGSDFVEMFVGVGASRVRDMFEQAKRSAPCIIFIDEIDAVGRHRGAGLGGGHDEREQTLNQMLVEMDGFEGKEGVIVMAATNRPDVLDPALLRPGRFDRQVVVPLPDIRGREQILTVHMQKVRFAQDIDVKAIARGTPGFSGADLANLVNESALFAARSNKKMVTMEELEKAKDKIMMGVERRSMVMKEDEKKLTAYHEAGHAIVGLVLGENHDPVYKVSIIPRGRALGITMFLPEEDRYSQTLSELRCRIASLFGGRLAEELVFGPDKVTTGASNDIERATALARSMVTKWGFSEKLGPLTYGEEEGEVFLGKQVTSRKEISDTTANIIDEEVRGIIDQAYQTARKILEKEMDKLHKMAEALIQYETIDANQLDDVMKNREVREPQDWSNPKPPKKPKKPAANNKKDPLSKFDDLGSDPDTVTSQ